MATARGQGADVVHGKADGAGRRGGGGELAQGRVGEVVQRLHVVAHLVGGAGEGGGHAGAELGLQHREHPRADRTRA